MGRKMLASKLFGVNRMTIYHRLNNLNPRKNPGRKRPDKLDEQLLLNDVQRHPDKLLRARAEGFPMSINGIWVVLRRLGMKKTLKYLVELE